MMFITALLAIAAAAPARHASAQAVPNTASSGKNLAGQYCVTCHVIAPSKQSGWTDAPSFVTIANRRGVTPESLSAFIQKSHANMMNDKRPKDEADALATYIVSLRNH